MIRRPPTSPPFPHTTLFRARPQAARQPVLEPHRRAAGRVGPDEDGGVPAHGARDRGTILEQDRKSTRLNSSHANILYAVFCLKKKKLSNPVHYITYVCLRLV